MLENRGDEVSAEDLLLAAEEFVKEKFKDHDPSHDWHHIHRVRLMALNLSRCPSLGEEPMDKLVLELAAIFHDLCDAKYLAAGTTFQSAASVISPFLHHYQEIGLVKEEQVNLINKIVDSISWSKEESRRKRIAQFGATVIDETQIAWENSCAEFKCVSDADRLDAIGSIGILRVAAFSAVKSRPLHIPPANAAQDSVPPAEQGEGYNNSAIAHFHQKLLKIRGDRLKIDMARQEAERRHTLMVSFLDELDLEWIIADQGAQLSLMD